MLRAIIFSNCGKQKQLIDDDVRRVLVTLVTHLILWQKSRLLFMHTQKLTLYFLFTIVKRHELPHVSCPH